MSKQVVHSYWAGALPPIIDLCLESIERHYKLILHTRDEIPSNMWSFVPRVQANYLRLTLLEKGNCVWMDADCVVRKAVDWTQYKRRDWYAYRYLKNLQTYWLKSTCPMPGLSKAYLKHLEQVSMHENHLTQFVKRQVNYPIKILEPGAAWNITEHQEFLRPYDGRHIKGCITHLIHTTIDAMCHMTRREVLEIPTLTGALLREAQ